ncbi:MAG: hypothetical protein E3J72_11600 [Planctomycetota bacterium]|nr:MAG: hypothetical protein E3J72_11600 [Planctomycetota bacterium]
MECDRIRELLSPFIDGEGSAEEAALVRKHTASCKDCRRHLEELKYGWNALGALTVPPISADYNAHFWKRLRPGEAGKAVAKTVSPWTRLRTIAACAAAAAVVLVLSLFLVFRDSDDTSKERVTFNEDEIVENLDILESLEIIEDLDVIEDLDILAELDETDFENL